MSTLTVDLLAGCLEGLVMCELSMRERVRAESIVRLESQFDR